MITIYSSNKLESLKEMLIEVISIQKSDNVFCSEVILTENMVMGEWLHIGLAKCFGVSCNIDFFSPFDFIYNIFYKSLWGIFPKSIISNSVMSWMLMKIFSSTDFCSDDSYNWSAIKNYLYNDLNKAKCSQLSQKMADLFFKYFTYRQDWLIKWEFGKTIYGLNKNVQFWQSELWRSFLREINRNDKGYFFYFQCNIYKYILNFLEKNFINNITKFPKRIFIYGVSSFSPILLEILQSLEKYIDIYVFCINPCRFFLEKYVNFDDVVDSKLFRNNLIMLSFSNCKESSSFNNKKSRNKKYIKNNNFLLSLWGTRFQEMFYSLLQLKFIYGGDVFIENIQSTSLLHMLQNDILNNYSKVFNLLKDDFLISNNAMLDIKKRLLCMNDYSLTVHVCHSIHREIEVLHDNLLTLMADDISLLPNEIIVLAPNINHYVSSIESVFNCSTMCNRYLPFTIFDSSINNINNIIVSSFLKLIKISYSRFSVQEILELLKVPSLAMYFNIDAEGVKLLSKWILESSIRWGLDDDMFSDCVTASLTGVQYTWEFGLKRMLLGYAIDSTYGVWNQILPHNILTDNGISSDLISQFIQFLIKLRYLKNRLTKFSMLEEWVSLCEDIINDFYINDFDSETESSLILLKKYWREIITSGMKANYCQPISIDILYNKLYDKLTSRKKKHGFFSGGITFCNLSSLCSIPFKIVYLLGMNLGDYPIHKTSFNFDLMKENVRRGDDNLWSSNRCLFLEALLSSKERFFISYVGCSIVDNKKCYPSVLVSELFEYIVHNFFYYAENTKNILPLTMNWIYDTFWNWHTSVPFEFKNFISGNKFQSFFKEWLLDEYSDINKYCSKFLYSLPILSINQVSVDNLYSFYEHPIRKWFQSRLKIYIPKILEIVSEEEFSVGMSIRYQIRKELISVFLDETDIDIVYQRIRCSGVLPYGSFGDIFWIEQCKKMLQLSQMIKKYYFSSNRHDKKVSLTINNFKLIGMLRAVQENGLLRWKPWSLSMRDGLSLWLQHLIYCVMGGEGDSWMFGINSSWHFHSLSRSEAKEYLLFFIFGYSQGMSIPLFLLNRSGGAWLRSCFNHTKKSISYNSHSQYIARRKLIMAWEGNQYINGECCDPYIKKLIPKLHHEDIESIILAAREYFFPFMKHNIKKVN